MIDYVIYLRGSGLTIEGKMKCADQLRALMRAPTAGIFELADNDGTIIVRVSEVSSISYEESKDAGKPGFKK